MNIEINLTWVFFFLIICLFLFLVYCGFGTRLFVKKDEHIAGKFLDKFPLVAPSFYNKTKAEQLAENNQEVHEINKRLDALEQEVKEKLDTLLERLNNG